jgi:hypothetical protein
MPSLDDYLIDVLDDTDFDEPYFLTWIRLVFEFTSLLGEDSDSDLERMWGTLLAYYESHRVPDSEIEDMRTEIVRLKGVGFWRDDSRLGLKFRCLNAVASTKAENEKDLYNWRYGVVTALQLINTLPGNEAFMLTRIQNTLLPHRAT